MGLPLFLSDNLFSVVEYPAHVLTQSEQAPGFESWHIANGRRSAFDYWTGITPNVVQTATVQCDRVRSANCVFLDRGFNYPGFAPSLQVSQDGVTFQTVVTPTLPTAVGPTVLTNSNGVLTEEGAWGLLFTVADGLYWRWSIPPLGSNTLPVTVGLWVGMAYVPQSGFLMPWSEDQTTLTVQETVSPLGWRGRGPRGIPKTGAITTKLLTDDEYDLARFHVVGLFGLRSRPAWICYDQSQADRTFLAIRPSGSGQGYGFEGGWYPRQDRIPYVEHEPSVTLL